MPRGRVTGGSSAINGQFFLRGVPEDYDDWADRGNDEWSYEKVLPYFRKFETDLDFPDDFHGTDGPILVRRFKEHEWLEPQAAFRDAALDAGFPYVEDFNHPDATGVGPLPLNNVDGMRISANVGFLNPARHRLNLTVRGDCLVRRLIFEGKRATGVEVESGGERFIVEGEEIILSAGPIGSPHILMLSGVGPEEQLAAAGVPLVHHSPGVGQNLRDHPLLSIGYSTKPGYPMDPDAPRYQVILRYTAENSPLRNDMQIVMISFASEPVATGGDGRTSEGIAIFPVLNKAVGKGEIRLGSADPTVQPLLDYNFFAEEEDRRRFRDGLRLCLSLGEHESFKDIIEARTSPSDEALDRWFMTYARTCHHISGTCKMGPAGDPEAVIDQYGRVYGVEALRVADVSIMPDCVRANTNATAMMIGERMADFIAEGVPA
ncbi:MAG: GMC family oxidoreductase N-terminal domain-containing protein [Chloroflexi bacterium]|nr:GMC family oxidoreductase N-terminal domain-containing protein [Chloroflexota bacterium]